MRVTCPKMYGADWKMPKRKAFTPEGVTLGATVEDVGRMDPLRGQVWSEAGKDAWWVVDAEGVAYHRETSQLTVIGQCVQESLTYTESEIDMATATSKTRKTTPAKPAATKPRATRTRPVKADHAAVPPAPPKWEDRKAARRALAAQLRTEGVKLTPELWAARKAEAGIR